MLPILHSVGLTLPPSRPLLVDHSDRILFDKSLQAFICRNCSSLVLLLALLTIIILNLGLILLKRADKVSELEMIEGASKQTFRPQMSLKCLLGNGLIYKVVYFIGAPYYIIYENPSKIGPLISP